MHAIAKWTCALRPARLLALCMCLALCASGLAALRSRSGIEAARASWTRMSQPEREELVARFREFQSLSLAERRELMRRGERLSALESELLEGLSGELRAKLDELEPKQRRRVLAAMLETELSDRGRRVREELASDWIARLEAVAPAERREVVREIEHEQLGAQLETLAERLELPAEERAALAELGVAEAEAELVRLQRALVARTIEEEGLPGWLGPEEWNTIEVLSDADFAAAWKRVLRRRSEPKYAAEASAERPYEHLREALRPDPAWHVELAELSPEERKQAFEVRIRERTLAALTELGIDPAELALGDFSELEGAELNRAVRARVDEHLRARREAEAEAAPGAEPQAPGAELQAPASEPQAPTERAR